MTDETSSTSKCPVMGHTQMASGSMANQHWWPHQLNLKVLNQNSPLIDPMGDKEWLRYIVQLLAGQIEAVELLDLAMEGDDEKLNTYRKAEAYFYIAQVMLVSGEKEKAQDYFQKCVDLGQDRLFEHDASVVYLHAQKDQWVPEN